MTDKKPRNTPNLAPYLIIKDADKAVEFYKDVLGAKEDFRMDWPDGGIMHISLRFGDSQIMMTEYRADMKDQKITQSNNYLYVDDPDAVFKKAKAKDAKVVMEPADMFYGDRTAAFIDPFGQYWTVALHVEDVAEDEMRRRAKEMFSKKAA